MNRIVSIIIPTYNRSKDLYRAINSVINQTYHTWELIIIDNHSVDETEQIVKSFNDNRIKYYKYHNNGIIAKSRNFGISISKGDYIAFLDSDDWWKINKLEKALIFLNKGFDFIYHNLIIKKKSFIFNKTVKAKSVKSPVYNYLLNTGNCIPCSSVILKKKLLIDTKGFSENPELVCVEDYDLWLRISLITNKFYFLKENLGYYWVGDNISNNLDLKAKNLNILELTYFKDYFINKKYPYWFLINKLYLTKNNINNKNNIQFILRLYSLKIKKFLYNAIN